MTVNEAIVRADSLRLNTLEDEQKVEWLRQLDGQLAETLAEGGTCPDPDPGPAAEWPEARGWPERDDELLMPFPHTDIYPLYLICKIDYYNQEMELYANDSTVYSAALAEALAWWRRNRAPRGGLGWEVGLP